MTRKSGKAAPPSASPGRTPTEPRAVAEDRVTKPDSQAAAAAERALAKVRLAGRSAEVASPPEPSADAPPVNTFADTPASSVATQED